VVAKCGRLIEDGVLVGMSPVSLIDRITTETVRVCTIVKGRRREKDGWSPETKGLTVNLEAIQHMSRFCNPNGLHQMWGNGWSEKNFRPHLNKILRGWRWEGRKICRTVGDTDRYLNLSCYGEAYWHKIKWVALVNILGEAHKAVKSMLHGAERKKRRLDINARVAKIEECVAKGKTGAAIRAVLGPKKAGFDLATLQLDGEVCCDQEAIGRATTEHFREWFEERVPSLNGCLGGPMADWADMFAPRNSFVSRMSEGGIPAALAEVMWPHFQRRVLDPVVLDDLHLHLAEPVSMTEWTGRIASLPKRSAGGPSGLTYDMIQA